ncbi:30S ribosomal protein S8 [Candidatus Phytoplasma phoenicium]|uniref:Small ribosomal subunit protein uS8 n=2 Tax=Candidatus Phytoplasma phoenicium TaxID=198422 RepID=A0A0L0MK61_9MOLU|nr:30S ribosomal protein S8 [Candidatus Phytoplasma phoenicium]
MITNPIADLLTRIRNANQMRYEKLSVPRSKLKMKMLEVIKKTGFIKDFHLDKMQKNILVYLKYADDKERVIRGLKRVSRYVSVKQIPKVSHFGIALISTSKGILTNHEALTQKIGGQVLAYIW